jgi:hypothetical protein
MVSWLCLAGGSHSDSGLNLVLLIGGLIAIIIGIDSMKKNK